MLYICAKLYNMKKKKTYFILINLFDLGNSSVCKTILEVAEVVGCHRNTIRPDKPQIRGSFAIIPFDM